ncbi:TetR/AcrR family transcriptional regulator [Holophaga foetida]|uniref:TetR/AcrR family transcriptional regulator n=1 Tax=Holophaga foetida TaxID=35839 RepID=UPI0002473EB5|nr:TetR/AcrR family transcriptional regulator [Holophaga foetida]
MTVAKSRGPKAKRIEPEKLLDAAQAVFSRDGLQAASMRAIAREAGCDPALIYYHFENKEAMFTAILDRKFPPMVRRFEVVLLETEAQHTAQRLWEMLGAVHAHMASDPGFRSLVRGELARGVEGIQEAIALRIKPVFETMLGVFREGIAKGEIRKDLIVPLGGFFFLRLYMEILDLVPIMAVRIAGVPTELVLPLARLAWFDLFWRGIASKPEEDLPFLASVRASLQEATDRIQLAMGSLPC